MVETVLTLERDELTPSWDSQHGRRHLSDTDYEKFACWVAAYREMTDRHDSAEDLLQLGREIHRWLDGDAGWLTRLLRNEAPPILLEFATALRPNTKQKSFLEVPWELLADADGHWALRADLQFVPIRRFGKRTAPPNSSPYRLSTVFMAAAPREEHSRILDYEGEETAILDATGTIGTDLIVEESGTLELLADTLAAEKPVDVLHISCHGASGPQPSLVLEDDCGHR